MGNQTFEVERSWLFKTKRDFAMRWKLEVVDNHFFERCVNLIHRVVDTGVDFDQLTDEIFLLVGEVNSRNHIIKTKPTLFEIAGKMGYREEKTFCFTDTEVFRLLSKNAGNEARLLEICEYILNFYLREKDNKLIAEFNDIALLSNKPIRLVYDGEYKFFPSDIEIFDKKLIDDVLEFLKDYPEAHRELSEALKLFLQQGSYKDCVDKTRRALEIFLKSFLKNNKSLEKQEEPIFVYFGNRLDTHIKTLFKTILSSYTKINNNRAKHSGQDSQPFNDYEVEFLFYLVGNFLRLFININNADKSKSN